MYIIVTTIVIGSPTKMFIKFAPYLHTKYCKLGIEYGAFCGSLVLMLLTKFVPNGTIRSCSSGTNFFNNNAIKCEPYLHLKCQNFI